MPITLGLNIASLRSQRQLDRSSKELGTVFERLSSGQRINRASDDAAGLAIAESLQADTRVFTQGIRNLNDGLSALNIADGALQELSSIVIRLNELAEQSANGTLGTKQREALDEEAQALSDEYFRIVQTTEFNDQQLFTADFGELRLQAGYGPEGGLADGLGGVIGTGDFLSNKTSATSNTANIIEAGDFNGDGFIDLATIDSFNSLDDTVSILLGSGDGAFSSGVSYAVGDNPDDIAIGDFNGDGHLDIVSGDGLDDTVSILLGNGDGSFGSASAFSVGDQPTSIFVSDVNGDGKNDVLTANLNDNTISVLIGNGDGTFQSADSYITGGLLRDITVGDFNQDGIQDIATADSLANTASILLGQGDGTFGTASSFAAGFRPTSVDTADFDGDGILDLVTGGFFSSDINVFYGQGDGTFGTANAISVGTTHDNVGTGDLNGDGREDIFVGNDNSNSISIILNQGDRTFSSVTNFTAPNADSAYAADIDGDGVLDIVSADSTNSRINVLLADTVDGVSPLLEFSLSSIAGAKQALTEFDRKLDQLAEQRGQIGAFMARIETASSTLTVATENFRAAESRIRDADIASESSQLTRLNILQQAASAVLAQANVQPQLALLLLGGGS